MCSLCGNGRTERTNLSVFCVEEPQSPTVYVAAAAVQLFGDGSARYVDEQFDLPSSVSESGCI